MRFMLVLRFSSAHCSRSRFGPRIGGLRRHALLACLCLLFFACFSQAQDGSGGSAPGSSTSQKFNVTGTVVNEATGEPIPRAMVTLQGSPMRSAFSDSNGGFTIEGVPAGRYTLQGQKPGFFGPQERGSRSMQSVEVGSNGGPVTLKLAAENVVFGRLTDVNGQPVESVSLHLTRRVLRNGVSKLELRSSSTSDDDGTFRFPSLQPGTYYLSAGPDVVRRETLFGDASVLRTGWPGLYYPQAPDIPSAAPIHLTSGQQVQADMVMNRVPLYTVSGLVAGFLPGQGVSLQVQNSSGDSVGAGVSFHEATGEFEIHLPAGSYQLKAFSQAGEQQLRSDVRITVEKDLTQLQIALQPAVSILIHARMEDHAQDASQSASSRGFVPARGTNEPPPVSVHLISSDPGGSDVYSVNSGTQNNRTLSLRSIEPGRYTAEISPYGGWYVESAQCGNANLLSEDLVVTIGTSCTLELSLRNDGGTLRAQVEGSQTTGSGMALLVPARGRRAPRPMPFYSSDPASPAQVGLTGIAPGDYLLYAFDTPEGVEYSNSEVLRSYSSQATPVTINPGQTTKVTTQVIETGTATE
jgi:Carboxypeptidase regulatory-like domain